MGLIGDVKRVCVIRHRTRGCLAPPVSRYWLTGAEQEAAWLAPLPAPSLPPLLRRTWGQGDPHIIIKRSEKWRVPLCAFSLLAQLGKFRHNFYKANFASCSLSLIMGSRATSLTSYGIWLDSTSEQSSPFIRSKLTTISEVCNGFPAWFCIHTPIAFPF